MAIEYLDKAVLDQVVSCFRRFIEDDTLTPGLEGKLAFMKAALARDDFLPEGVMGEIESRRGCLAVSDYLRLHLPFSLALGCYLP